jgi:hypothetical protein
MNKFNKLYEATMNELTSNEGLAWLLSPAGDTPTIGDEKGKVKPNGVSVLKSPFGSYRYVYSKNGDIVSAIQIMSRDGKNGIVANVFTHKDHRRKGYATALHKQIQKDFTSISHSDDRSDDGANWIKSL